MNVNIELARCLGFWPQGNLELRSQQQIRHGQLLSKFPLTWNKMRILFALLVFPLWDNLWMRSFGKAILLRSTREHQIKQTIV